MFDLSIPKLLVLVVIALVIFGPNELPKIAAQAGRALRDLRRIAEGATNDLREELNQAAQQPPAGHAAANGTGSLRD
ncbi:MAG TPA: twin-arginine translocase TatA/TatE family subunit [Trebonia sp.]|nr:twin-arginine translocase TatA/TatE family subunit [Trebonia sp.]